MKREFWIQMLSKDQRKGATSILAILTVLLLALLLRISYGGGMNNEQSFSLAKIAITLAQSIHHASISLQELVAELRSEFGICELLYSIPIAFSHFLFGVNEFSSTLFPLIASLTAGILMYMLLEWKVNHTAGLLGLFLWAVFPTEVFYSTVLFSPALLTSLVILSIFLAYKWIETKSNINLVLIGFFFMISVLTNLIYGLFLLFSCCYIIFQPYISPRRIWGGSWYYWHLDGSFHPTPFVKLCHLVSEIDKLARNLVTLSPFID